MKMTGVNRGILKGLICATCVILSMVMMAAGEPKMTTHVYKTVGDLEIKADVYAYPDNLVRPLVVNIHGGALIMGGRQSINGRIRKMAFENGYVLISLDYRLAPETQLPEIIKDIEDAFRWIRKEGPAKFHVDIERIAVCGGSAGGYLTLASGYRVQPRPQVLLSLWGYGDLIGDWYSQPSSYERHYRIKMSETEAWKQVSGKAIANSADREGHGGAFYQFCRQKGLWPKAVSGWNPVNQAEKFFPFMPMKNVTSDFPPTFLIHGTQDTDVPHQQSVMMAREFIIHRVEHRFLSISQGEHGLPGADPEQVEGAYKQAFEFITRILGKVSLENKP
ncbi:MAG TPA: alpha/beta hydrolase [Verrucomicrobiales bacterium]|nr:alpha/beta hydrolase [Verrucomicrobiales bacterium]HIL72263.1 alpha/beta hydrolase [Verrucomicrobiota bacterium]